MKIAFLSPISLNELQPLFSDAQLPRGLSSSLFVKMIYYYLERGHEITLCTTDNNIRKSKIFKNGNITIFVAASIKTAKLRAATSFKFEINQIYRFLMKHPCDIYHAHWTYEFASAALKVNPDRTLITIHDWAPKIYELYHDFYRYQRYKMNNVVLEKGEYFSTVSNYMRDEFSALYKNKCIKIIPNYIHLAGKVPMNKRLNQKAPIIIAINNGFNKAKNAAKIIEAFKIIHQEIPSSSLVMLGEGFEENGAAHLWATSKDLAEGIIFKGKVTHDEVMSELKKVDLMIHASLEESFGMGILEAMYQKTVVVGGNKSGAIPWLLKGGDCGALVDVTNFTQIANESIGILKSPKIWEKYAVNGLKRVNDFSIQQVAEQYLDYYVEIANNSKFI